MFIHVSIRSRMGTISVSISIMKHIMRGQYRVVTSVANCSDSLPKKRGREVSAVIFITTMANHYIHLQLVFRLHNHSWSTLMPFSPDQTMTTSWNPLSSVRHYCPRLHLRIHLHIHQKHFTTSKIQLQCDFYNEQQSKCYAK